MSDDSVAPPSSSSLIRSNPRPLRLIQQAIGKRLLGVLAADEHIDRLAIPSLDECPMRMSHCAYSRLPAACVLCAVISESSPIEFDNGQGRGAPRRSEVLQGERRQRRIDIYTSSVRLSANHQSGGCILLGPCQPRDERIMIAASAPFASLRSDVDAHIGRQASRPESDWRMYMPLQRDARVVVVDDDTFFVEAMLVLLPQLGLAPVACAMDGAEAIAVVREHDPDVVLVDLEMPHVDGVEAIKEISRTSPNTTLLAVTGLTDPQRAADAVAAGALACLSKADVRERLEALIAQGS